MKYKVYSFDVFDTCLTRIYARPKDLWLDLSMQLTDGTGTNTAEQLARYRQLAGKRAKKFARPHVTGAE